ncbi:MAG: low molecular weight protein-tyrosine-phosphatase [Bacteroidota bacterium]
MKILMVCLGNICRSPLAEGILKKKVEENQLDWEVGSAGTGAWHVGELPDNRSIRTARQHGIDITDQRARQFTAKDFKDYDLILAMDSTNYRNILQLDLASEYKDKVKMILNYLEPQKNESVPDPYWNDNGFEKVYQMLEAACTALVEQESDTLSS